MEFYCSIRMGWISSSTIATQVDLPLNITLLEELSTSTFWLGVKLILPRSQGSMRHSLASQQKCPTGHLDSINAVSDTRVSEPIPKFSYSKFIFDLLFSRFHRRGKRYLQICSRWNTARNDVDRYWCDRNHFELLYFVDLTFSIRLYAGTTHLYSGPQLFPAC